MARPPDFEWLKADRRLVEATAWEPWLKQVARTRRAFAKFIETDPMTNETASCGVLASAASSSGLLSMAEYLCVKKHKTDYRRRRNGRADLWVGDRRRVRSWAFEAKQLRCRAGARVETFEKWMADAAHDASRMEDLEADDLYGLLIATLPSGKEAAHLEGVVRRLEAFAAETDLACRVGGARSPAFVYFRRAFRNRSGRA